MAGEPFWITMPEVWGIRLTGELPDWVSAKDVILELLRRHSVAGGRGKVLEFHGPGLDKLSIMDRHVICNMGVEMGAPTSLFPSDDTTRHYLQAQGRGDAWTRIEADDNADYALRDEVDLSQIVPLIAKPSSPDNVVPVADLAGDEIYQAYIGSSANPGYRDTAVVALMVAGRRLAPGVSLDVNPASRQALEQLIADGRMAALVRAGARIHQTGCNGCVGMGQAPASGRRSLRTVPRNSRGRSGTPDDQVYLCSPETAAASALTGVITDPRTLKTAYPKINQHDAGGGYEGLITPPLRTGVEPRACGARSPSARAARCPRCEHRPHPQREPCQLRYSAADLRGPRRRRHAHVGQCRHDRWHPGHPQRFRKAHERHGRRQGDWAAYRRVAASAGGPARRRRNPMDAREAAPGCCQVDEWGSGHKSALNVRLARTNQRHWRGVPGHLAARRTFRPGDIG